MACNNNSTPAVDFSHELYGEVELEEVEFGEVEYEEVVLEDVELAEVELELIDLEEVELQQDYDDGVNPSYDRASPPPPRPPSPLLSPTPPTYSPLSSPERRDRSPVWQQRRSDLSPSPSRSIVWIKEEDPLNDEAAGVPVDDGEAFMTPDAHSLFGCSERLRILSSENVTDDRNDSSVVEDRGVVDMSVRGRLRGGRKARVSRNGRRGHRTNSRRGETARWFIGHPLEEIWMTDDDVPLVLREMARDVVRRRQTSAQASANVNRSTQEGHDSESEDEFEDATDGRGNSLLEEVSTHFEWSPMETFRSSEETFRPKRTGSVYFYSSPYDAFRSYWDDSILKVIVDETNRHASKISSDDFHATWYPTNSHEVLCLFAFWMMLGTIKMPTIRSCFSLNPLLKTDIFRCIFTYTRHCNLVRALSFIDTDPSHDAAFPSNSDPMSSFDRMHSLRPIIDHLNAKFQANYVMSRDICIDESLILWKGRLDIRQYIRTKAAKLGIKTFELCESATGYLWSFFVYTGKYNSSELEQDPTVLKSTAIVKKLIAPLLNKGYRLFMDNWYNSPLLARFLKRNGTDCVGTLNPSRRDVPFIVNKAPLRQGQLIARHSGDVCVLSWQDKKRVTMISTCHGSAVGLPTVLSRPLGRSLPYKPQVVLDYNKWMGGVDLKDQMLEPYLLERKRGAKWHMKLFKRLLNCSILNARTLLQSSRQSPVDHLQFRLQLVDSILSNHLSHCPKTRRAISAFIRYPHPTRFVDHSHWPVSIPHNASAAPSNRKKRQRCAVCAKNSIEVKTSFKCQTCDVALCVENCFRIYHTT